jgi:toxin ParE1/3/4
VAQAFIDAIEDAVYRIREAPTRYPVIDEDVRRCMARLFPYGILYTIEQDYILILAVMHSSREPGYWKSRR